MDNDSYLLLLLSDGNLPTGSFVSSSGLESYFKHGFPAVSGPSNVPANIQATVSFIKQSLAADAHEIAVHASALTGIDTFHQLQELDGRYEAMTLNHITRRASKAQGVALLTLFSRGFSRPTWVDSLVEGEIELSSHEISAAQKVHETLVDAFKLSIRKGETPGHLPVCWGVLTASLLLSKGLSSTHIQPTALTYSSCPASSEPAALSLSLCPLTALCCNQVKHHRSLCCTAASVACHSTHGR
jgi:urease accessory protein